MERVNTNLRPPDWSIQPRNLREVLKEDGSPTFEFLHIPEQGLWPLSQVAFTVSESKLQLPEEIVSRKEGLISQREAELAGRYQIALEKWRQAGSAGDAPPEPSFFDGPLVRVIPNEIFTTSDNKGNPLLVIPLGRTSYFDYVATRDLNQSRYSQESMALPLGMCGVLTALDRKGQEQMIYSVRTTRPESYQEFFHVVGGMLARPDWDMANPTGAWIKELKEEAGIWSEEVEIEGSLGVVMDTYWPHPEFTHKARLGVVLEDVFDQEGVNLRPKRETDKEVILRSVPWRPEIIKALIIGEKIEDGDEDLRPWVPTGLANLLLAGRVDFGQEWFEQTLKAYKEKVCLLK